MKYHIYSIGFFFIFLYLSPMSGMMAQNNTDNPKFNREVFQAKRNAYIIAEIGLTAEEAEVFIPLENELKKMMFELGKECRKLVRESRSEKNITDQQFIKLIDCTLDTRQKELEVEKEYYEKFKKILTPQKLYKYQQADSKFMREFMRGRNRDRRNNNGGEK